jgi:PAS domain S-box-containing protein
MGIDITVRKQAELALIRQKDLYDALSQTNQTIVRGASREELFQSVCRIAVEQGHFLFAWIALIDKDDPWLKPVATYGDDAGYMAALHAAMSDRSTPKRGLSWLAIDSGAHTVANDFLTDPETAPRHEAARRCGVRAFAAFPIRQTGEVVGVINVYAGAPGFFTDDLLATLDEMAIDVSFALDNLEREADRKRAEEKARANENRLRVALSNINMAVFHQDRTLRYTWMYQPQLGYRPEQIVGHTDAELLPPEAALRVTELKQRVIEKGETVHEEVAVAVKDATFFYDLSAEPLREAGGAIIGLTGVTLDITERKLADEARRESEERLRAIFEGALDGIVAAEPETGKFVTANSAMCRMLGYSLEDITRLGISDIHPKQDLQRVMEQFNRMLRAEIELAEDIPVMRKDGSVFYADIKGAPIRLGGKDSVLGVFRDITTRKRAEEEVLAAEEQFRGLVEQSIAGIYIIQDGKFAYVNPRFAEIRGYGSANELLGRDNVSVVAEKDRDIVAENIRRLLAGETRSVNYAITALRKDGSTVEVGVHGARATYKGRPAVIGLMQDISEKKRAEEQIQQYIAQLETAFMSTVEVATTLSEMRDPYTAGHERRVAEIAVAIGAEMGLDARRQEGLRVAGYLHDVGKITIPSEILSKPGKLTAIEFQLIKGHAQASYEVLKAVNFPWPVAQVALQHHERMDGSGYPQGLKGEAILIEARIMAVGDVIEAMSSHRPYRPGLGIDKALAEVERGRGSAYDPEVADACLRLFRERRYQLPA